MEYQPENTRRRIQPAAETGRPADYDDSGLPASGRGRGVQPWQQPWTLVSGSTPGSVMRINVRPAGYAPPMRPTNPRARRAEVQRTLQAAFGAATPHWADEVLNDLNRPGARGYQAFQGQGRRLGDD